MKKNNPWLEIPYSDYENHMIEVGQAQVLNKLTKISLDKFTPMNFALLGCSTGNGLEHLKPSTTKNVYAIDINPEYLEKTKEKFADKIDNLEIYNIDIRKDDLVFNNIDLFFIALVLEYVEPLKVLEKVISTINYDGVLVLVIQKTGSTTFVSKTKYTSMEKLYQISHEPDEKKIDAFIQSKNMRLIERKEIDLKDNKSFISLTYRMKRK